MKRSGFLLLAVLLLALPARGGEAATARARFPDPRAGPLVFDEAKAECVVTRIAPYEQRKVDFLFEDEKMLAELLMLQVLVAGRDPRTPTLEGLFSRPPPGY